MITQNKVSLWLGTFKNEASFRDYIQGSYDEDGNYVPSIFQRAYDIDKYDLDAIESGWITDKCFDVESLLLGFSGDSEIIPRFKHIIGDAKLELYNSVLLLYNFEYDGCYHTTKELQFIGCVDVHLW